MKAFLKRLPAHVLIGIAVVYFFNITDDPGSLNFWISAAFSVVYTIIMWEGNLVIIRKLRRRYPDHRQTGQRITAQVAICIAYTVIAVILTAIVLHVVTGNRNFSWEECLLALKPSLLVTLTVVSMNEAGYFFANWKNTILEAEQLKRENIQSQLETLKSQVNPHFLFNSLNTLITLIPENQEVAVEFVQKLSNVYRYILQNKDRELVTLAEEMKIAEAYLFLLKTRFGENLKVDIRIPANALNRYVAPLTIQMLLENAIKHNIVSTEKPLHIDLYVEKDEVLVVKNNLQRKNSVPDSTQTGLANISGRYKILCQKAVEVIVTATNFIVILPLLSVEKNGQRH